MLDTIKRWIMKAFNVIPAQDRTITIRELTSYEVNVLKNRLLYRGDPSELDQFFGQIADDNVYRARFWASRPSKGLNIRKYHSGIPSMVVNVLADIVTTDMLDVTFDTGQDAGRVAVWQDIAEENKFKKLVNTAVTETLIVGDGAFKISIDTDLSEYPILEFKSGEEVRYKLNRGRIEEIIFITRYTVDKSTYTLLERYGGGYVRYELVDKSGKRVSINKVPEIAGLTDIEWDDDTLMLAIPLKVYDSPKWGNEGRGRGIYDVKTDALDALDETISQWQDAIRLGRIKRYIPESMIPRDPKTGNMLPVNPLDNQFTALADPLTENGESRIVTDQPHVQVEAYIATYINNLDMCLQGIVSPSTLGIDTKKLDNAEAQREKEKTTLYTRQKIIDVLQEVLPEVVSASINAYEVLNGRTTSDITCTIDFGEYANPSFEAQVQVIGAAAGSQIMSIEAQVNTLWGDTRDKAWIEAEIARIKQEKGIAEVEEPMVKPHGFSDEERAQYGDMDRLDNQHTDRSGDIDVPIDEAEPQAAQAGGDEGAGEMDAMAGVTSAEPEADKARVKRADR